MSQIKVYTKYKQVFSGKTATIFLQKYICDDQHDIEGARDIGTWMMREQFIVPVSGKARTGGSGKSGKIFSISSTNSSSQQKTPSLSLSVMRARGSIPLRERSESAFHSKDVEDQSAPELNLPYKDMLTQMAK